MAVDVTIKSKGFFKKQLELKDVLLDDMRYGTMDDAYRLEEGKTGEYTIIFPKNHICRGYDISFKKGKIDLRMPLPTSREDIQYFYHYIKILMEKMHNDKFIRDEEEVTADQIDICIRMDVEASEKAFQDMEKNLGDGTYESMAIFGAMNPISIGKQELEKIDGSAVKFGELMHSLQSIDAYYAAPKVYQKPDESLFGMYVLTEGVTSIFPYQGKLLMADKNIKIEHWYVSFVVNGEMVGVIPYKDFVQSVDDKKEYDTEHFIVTLNQTQIQENLSHYKVEL